MYIVSDHLDSKFSEQLYNIYVFRTEHLGGVGALRSSVFAFLKSWRTWGDLMHQEGGLGGQSEAMRVEGRVSLDLNVEPEGVVPLITATGLCCLPIHCNPVSGEEKVDKND